MTKLTLTLTLIDPQDDEKNIMVQIEVGLMKKSECKQMLDCLPPWSCGETTAAAEFSATEDIGLSNNYRLSYFTA